MRLWNDRREWWLQRSCGGVMSLLHVRQSRHSFLCVGSRRNGALLHTDGEKVTFVPGFGSVVSGYWLRDGFVELPPPFRNVRADRT